MKIGGWRSRSVFERYAIVSQTDIADALNSVASDGGCNDWYIDPIPAGYDGNGNPIPGAAIGRLVYFAKHSTVNEGDYYFRFHLHITRP